MILLAAFLSIMSSLSLHAQVFTGDGTAYTLINPSNGNCNFMSWPFRAVTNYVAINNAQWDQLRSCGRCIEVWCIDPRCTSKSRETVHVMDRCPECKYGDLDLSPAVYKKITGSSPSRLKVSWRFVPCPIQESMKICLKAGSNPYWQAFQATNAIYGVKSMKINGKEGQMLDSAFYFKLQSGNGMSFQNIKVTVTSLHGSVVQGTVSLTPGNCVAIGKQFPSVSSIQVVPQSFNQSALTQQESSNAQTTETVVKHSTSQKEADLSNSNDPSKTNSPVSSPIFIILLAIVGLISTTILIVTIRKKRKAVKGVVETKDPAQLVATPTNVTHLQCKFTPF